MGLPEAPAKAGQVPLLNKVSEVGSVHMVWSRNWRKSAFASPLRCRRRPRNRGFSGGLRGLRKRRLKAWWTAVVLSVVSGVAQRIVWSVI